MTSGDRVSGIIAFFLMSAFVAFVFLVSSCQIESGKRNLELAKIEMPIKLECMKNHGMWVPRDDDGRPPYVCKIK